MKIIKRTILRAVITGTTSGCTNNCHVIIPDLNAKYYIKISLSNECHDLGFFDVYDFSPYDNNVAFSNGTSVITGSSNSRLSELKKYAITLIFNEKYFGNGNFNNNGVDFNASNENTKIIYYIDGIKYVDNITISGINTTFNFTSQGISNISFVNKPIYKNPNKSNVVSNPKIDDDVFISRQELSVFNDNYKIEFLSNLVELETFAGGKYFNVKNNS